MRVASLVNTLRRYWHGRAVEVFHHPAYRLAVPTLQGRGEFEPRRADFALWYLLSSGALAADQVLRPRRVTYQELARVHTAELLDGLSRAEKLAAVFSVDPADVRVDEVLGTFRLACGGTLLAAQACLDPERPRLGRRMLNLFGGFHHAGPARAGGFCPVNDVAVAVAALRADGFAGQVAVLDLDAHPPDGIAECLRGDRAVWIGSISGVSWGALPSVDETVLPPGADDAAYLAALDGLLARMPPAQLAFVIAGSDVLRGDALGQLGLSLAGARRRDLRVAAALLHTPSVWLPGGGYSEDAWRALAGTGMALSVGTSRPVPRGFDPLEARFSSIARTLGPEELGSDGGSSFSMDDLAEDLGLRSPQRRLLLGFYSAEGVEHALSRYGLLAELTRLGYGSFRTEISAAEEVGDRLRLYGSVGPEGPADQLLGEAVLERRTVEAARVLYVHWLTLRNPAAGLLAQRPRLPGQEVPGLGLAREVAELMVRMAERLELEGIVFRPANFHTAWQARAAARFVDAARQGRFEALVRDLGGVPLLEIAQAMAEGRVRMNGAAYAWEADEMARWLRKHPADEAAATRERERVRFTLSPEALPAAPAAP
jgi:acetoin utilization deacetylase AcuC-like enzyme